MLEVRVAADGFLPHMVRNIVGALLDVGQGRRDPNGSTSSSQSEIAGWIGYGPGSWAYAYASGFSGDVLDDD